MRYLPHVLIIIGVFYLVYAFAAGEGTGAMARRELMLRDSYISKAISHMDAAEVARLFNVPPEEKDPKAYVLHMFSVPPSLLGEYDTIENMGIGMGVVLIGLGAVEYSVRRSREAARVRGKMGPVSAVDAAEMSKAVKDEFGKVDQREW